MRLWSKAELATRASAWAERRGAQPVSIATILKWREAGLLQRPTVRPLGRGRGSLAGWPWTEYRRLLRIVRIRQQGLRRLRDLRLALWLDGDPIELEQVRTDLISTLKELAESINR